ncbi:MAG TPA: M50 family metallopeptidase, partial [Anaerolineales bacterium]|nr:M50 family metallopeptidase [Anaerolineales bacterium]
IFLHELGHAFAAKLVHAEVKSIILWLLGGLTSLNREPEKPIHRLVIYVAGPFMTFLLGLLFLALFFYTTIRTADSSISIYWRLFLSLAVLNTVLFIFNILPAYPLDGGRILQALSEFFFGKSRANLITMVISVPVLLGLIVFGIYTHDYILLFFCIFIGIAISTLNQRTLRWVNLGINYIFRRAGYYYLQGDFDRAAHYCTRAIGRNPKQVNNYLLRAACYLNMLQYQNALLDVQQALSVAPNHEMALMLRGDICVIERDIDTALEWYERAHQINPNSALPYFGRGSARIDKNEFQPALEQLNIAISMLASVPLFYVVRSKAHYRLGNLNSAHQDQDTALHLSEKDALTRAPFNLQFEEGYLDWAEDYYAHVLQRRPRSGYAYQGRADAYRVNHEYEKAISDYTQALKMNPRAPRLYLGRGICYQAKGETDCAIADFRYVSIITNKPYLQRQAKILLESLQ